ncbi:hypothetical protein HHK36_006278 [Tetracentron sinense]|uniref:Uncharacterized protein n=1 Tax=Tetracentron sinense TaxID=13715 RepID=A0A834ZRJ4_TETSI|nr:hypothetical protein HHK36_006278 [Tetracentron sinense]
MCSTGEPWHSQLLFMPIFLPALLIDTPRSEGSWRWISVVLNEFWLEMVELVVVLSLCSLKLNRKQKKLVVTRTPTRKGNSVQMIRSVLGNRKSSTGNSDNGATEPATVLLERVFAQTQMLEAQMSRDSSLPQDIQLGFNLEILESDLQAALAALRKKEEDLQDAERTVLLERAELNHAKQELEQREEEIAVARSKQEKLEEDHKQVNDKLASQARQIEDLKFLFKERDQEIVAAQFALSLKEDDLNRMRNELAKMREEAAKNESDLKAKDKLLNEANEVIKKQEAEVQEFQKTVREKKQELEVSVVQQKLEEEKLKLAETNLEKRTMEWLSTQEELKKLEEEASKHMGETKQTLEDFRRVKKLLADVRSELVSSQKSLAFSRQKMEEQEHQLKKQLAELEEQKIIIMSYMTSLNDAQREVESEKAKLRIAEVQNKELEQELSMEKGLLGQLQEELNKERSSLTQALLEISVLREELDQKTSEFGEVQKLLQSKESELVEARLQIQHLISEQTSIQHILREKDTDLLNAQKNLDEVNQEVAELKILMNSREDQLIQVTAMLQEKEEHVQIMQHELDDTKLKFSEAATAVERIVNLTNKMVISVKDEEGNSLILFNEEITPSGMEHKLVQHVALRNLADMSREELKQDFILLKPAARLLRARNGEKRAYRSTLDFHLQNLRLMLKKKRPVKVKKDSALTTIIDLVMHSWLVEAETSSIECLSSCLNQLVPVCRNILNYYPVSYGISVKGQEWCAKLILKYKKNKKQKNAERNVAKVFLLENEMVLGTGLLADFIG